ncbi:MAG: amidohydrolase [Terrisporobacter sp.]
MTKKLFYNGDIITLEDELYAEAVLIENGKISKVGKKEELMKSANNADMIDLEGKTLIPSFIDPHSHFSGYANSLLQVSLEDAVDFDDIADRIDNFMKKNNIKKGEWILASNFDPNGLKEKTYPRIDFLDKISPENPLGLQNKSGHNGVFNSLGLKEFNITVDTPNPEGGVIYKEDSKLTGYLEENAYINNIQTVPMASMEDMINALMRAQKIYASYGITTMQEGMVVPMLADLINYLRQAKLLMLDYIGYVDLREKDKILPKMKGCIKQYDNRFKVNGYKIFLDGSPQGKTAYMRTPYKGAEDGYLGYPVLTDEQLEGLVEIALKENMQLLAHCNGDAAVAQYMTQYKNAREKLNASNDIRPVIIHAQLIGKDQLPEAKKLGMIPSFFVAHVYHWGHIHVNNFGLERASQISPAKTALDLGIKFTFHQDAPVIEPNMIETMWIAVNRKMKDGQVLGADEKIPPLAALQAVTINAAYQYFEEDIKGSIKENKLADLVILDKNPLKVESDEIKNIKVLETMKEGNTIFKAE